MNDVLVTAPAGSASATRADRSLVVDQDEEGNRSVARAGKALPGFCTTRTGKLPAAAFVSLRTQAGSTVLSPQVCSASAAGRGHWNASAAALGQINAAAP